MVDYHECDVEKINDFLTESRNEMSQAKVEQKKEARKNREKLARKNKIETIIAYIITGVVVLAILGWLGFSVYQKYDAYKASQPIDYKYYEVDLGGMTDYLSEMQSAE